MKLFHNEVVKDFLGNPIRDVIGQNDDGTPIFGENLTMRDLAVRSLMAPSDVVTAENKARRFAVAQKFYRSSRKVDLTVDEAAFVKECAGEPLIALAFGRLCDWLEGKPQTIPDDEDGDEE